jgi:hypothetical protein
LDIPGTSALSMKIWVEPIHRERLENSVLFHVGPSRILLGAQIRLYFVSQKQLFGRKIAISEACLFIYINCKWVLPGGSGTTIRHNTQITHITQNNTSRSNKTHHTKLHKQ